MLLTSPSSHLSSPLSLLLLSFLLFPRCFQFCSCLFSLCSFSLSPFHPIWFLVFASSDPDHLGVQGTPAHDVIMKFRKGSLLAARAPHNLEQGSGSFCASYTAKFALFKQKEQGGRGHDVKNDQEQRAQGREGPEKQGREGAGGRDLKAQGRLQGDGTACFLAPPLVAAPKVTECCWCPHPGLNLGQKVTGRGLCSSSGHPAYGPPP